MHLLPGHKNCTQDLTTKLRPTNLQTKKNEFAWNLGNDKFLRSSKLIETFKSLGVQNSLLCLKPNKYSLQPMTAAWLDSKVESGVCLMQTCLSMVFFGESSDVMFALRFLRPKTDETGWALA